MILAGGTGGHVFPGLAVADEMRSRGWEVVWMGSRGGMEARLVPAHGYRMAWIHARALRGKGLAAKLLLPLNLLLAFWQSARAIFAVRPDVVLGMGGYVAFPGGLMASLLAKPLAIHEQNAIAGLTNRVLRGVADRAFEAFPGALKNAEWTGNPVRAEIAGIALPAERYASRSGPLKLLVVGGSLGAQALNYALPRALALIPQDTRPQVVHQSGESNLDALREYYGDCGRAGRAGCVHRRHGRALRGRRPRHLPRRCDHRCGAVRGRCGQRAGAISPRGRRPPDGERDVSRRAGCRPCCRSMKWRRRSWPR